MVDLCKNDKPMVKDTNYYLTRANATAQFLVKSD